MLDFNFPRGHNILDTSNFHDLKKIYNDVNGILSNYFNKVTYHLHTSHIQIFCVFVLRSICRKKTWDKSLFFN